MFEYRYLNMDTKEFVPDMATLADQIGPTGLLREMHQIPPGEQVLVAGSQHHFTRVGALTLCRRITGLTSAFSKVTTD